MPKIHTCKYNISQLNFYISLWEEIKEADTKTSPWNHPNILCWWRYDCPLWDTVVFMFLNKTNGCP